MISIFINIYQPVEESQLKLSSILTDWQKVAQCDHNSACYYGNKNHSGQRPLSANSAHDAWLILSPLSHSLLLLIQDLWLSAGARSSLLKSTVPQTGHQPATQTPPQWGERYIYFCIPLGVSLLREKTGCNDGVARRRGKKRDVVRGRSIITKEGLLRNKWKRWECEPQGKMW